MKKYDYFTMVAALLIVCLQAVYIKNLYSRHVADVITDVEETLRIVLDKELHLRRRNDLNQRIGGQQNVFIKRASDMMPEELDSLKRLSKEGDTINIMMARKKGIGDTTGDVFNQLGQDFALEKGKPLNLKILDSLFVDSFTENFPHSFFLYGQNKVVVETIGNLEERNPDYESALDPIGTKGFQYLQIKMAIPMSDFIKHQIWTLILSAGFMGIVLMCLFYQLTEIRHKNILLLKREASVNGTIHDLKAPLNSMLTLLSWFKMNETDAQKKEMLEIAKTRIRHLVYHIECLLLTARKDRQKILLKKTPIDLPSLVEIVKKELNILYQDKPHTIEMINKLPERVLINADPMYVENVVRNLIENSLKYSDNGVVIRVILNIRKGKLEVTVKDNGWGIAPVYRKKLFTPFYQVPRTPEQIRKGHGIGLAQAKYIVEEHGGEIKLQGEETQGCVFVFTLPLS